MDDDDDIVLTPLCTMCVGDVPAEGSDVCGVLRRDRGWHAVRINAARDVETHAWPRYNPGSVQIKIGVIRLSATPEEAEAFAQQLIDAAATARETR